MNELTALVILSQLPHLGPIKIRMLINRYGTASKALEADSCEIGEMPGFGKIAQNWKNWEKNSAWQKDLELAERHQIQIIPFTDKRYPKRLLELHDAPVLLYVQGEIKATDQRSLAVVGTRYATRYGLEMAEKISRELAELGFTIVSGLARGIDTAAHAGAIESGRTLAVIGSGLLEIYPKENLLLGERIKKQGALISEFPIRTPPDRLNFPQRNRIVSGMTLGTVLIEAPVESGAMITMQKAFSQNRKLFALPGRADWESFGGNHSLIKTSQAQLIENAQDIASHFQDLLGNVRKTAVFTREKIELEPEEERLLNSLTVQEMTFDEIARLTKLPAMKLNILLMGLILKKAIKEFPGKIYKKAF